MYVGIDIGGTKCAVVLGDEERIVNKIKFPTTDYKETMEKIIVNQEVVKQVSESLPDEEKINLYNGGH